MVNSIKGFFEKFINLDKKRTNTKKLFIESVRVSSGIELAENQVTILDNKVVVNGAPALKNELFINRDKILKEYNRTSVRKISIIG